MGHTAPPELWNKNGILEFPFATSRGLPAKQNSEKQF